MFEWYRRRVARAAVDRDLVTLSLSYAGLFVVMDAYHQALPLYFQAVGVPLAVLGFAQGAGSALEALVSAPAGVLADRVDRILVATVAGGILAVLLAVLATVTTALALSAVVVAVAVVRLVLSNSLTPLLDETITAGSEGLGWGVRDVGIYLGGATGLALGGAAVAAYGDVRYVFLAVAPAMVLTVAVLWTVRRPRPGDVPSLSDLRGGWSLDLRGAYRSVSRPGVLARFCAVQATVGLGVGMSLFLLPALAVDLGIRPERFLFLFAGSHLFAAPLSLAGGALADRVSRKALYVGNFAVEAVMLAAFALAGGPALFVVGVALFVVQTAFEPAVLAYFFDQFADDEAGRAWGLEGAVARSVGVVAPAAGGVLYGLDPQVPFVLGAVFTAAGALVALSLP